MYKRVLTIQDVSCVGQCSLTVALPILSACGLETAVIPSAVLSTHTAGFSGYTFRDLTEDMPAILAHWEKENLSFDSIYTGYLGSTEQIDYVKAIAKSRLKDGGRLIVDPAMADNGNLYPAFDKAYVEAMKTLCAEADVLVPNITEACFLTDFEYKESYDEAYILALCKALFALSGKDIVLTGVGYEEGATGVVTFDGADMRYYKHRKIANGCHGTGDVYASAFVGALENDQSLYNAAKTAADYTLRCIEYTQGDENHWYGVKFEPVLKELIEML